MPHRFFLDHNGPTLGEEAAVRRGVGIERIVVTAGEPYQLIEVWHLPAPHGAVCHDRLVAGRDLERVWRLLVARGGKNEAGHAKGRDARDSSTSAHGLPPG